VQFAADGSLMGTLDPALDAGLLGALQNRTIVAVNLLPRNAEGVATQLHRAEAVLAELRRVAAARRLDIASSAAAGTAVPSHFAPLLDLGGDAVDDLIVLGFRG
jgi:hypothetical protein